MSFSELGLSEPLLRAVADHGYTTPTPIQAQAIPAVLAGGDLMAQAQTGTGKTAGFTLPILERLAFRSGKGPSSGRPPIRALVLVPTRELAAQVEESVKTYGKYLTLTSMSMFGGVGINPQITKLRSRVDILVATPGRLLDHVGQKTVDLSKVEILVLDEADRMLDMGFIRDIKRVLVLLPKVRQNLLFSATFSDAIRTLADGLLNNPASIQVAQRNAAADTVSQRVYKVDRVRKQELLAHLIVAHKWKQVLVFTRTKHGANRLAELLCKDGITALAIHGNKSQSARTRALSDFKRGELRVLVATDLAARGIDISELPHVVNYELPHSPQDYVHRIGRTGRAGLEGEAVSLVCIDEDRLLADIERLLKRPLPSSSIRGFEPDPRIPAEPIPNGGSQRGGRGDQGSYDRGDRSGRSDRPRSGGFGGRSNDDRKRSGYRTAETDPRRPAKASGQSRPPREGAPASGRPFRAGGGASPAKPKPASRHRQADRHH